MIISIEKIIKEDLLEVLVTTSIRSYATQPIKTLEDKDILDILKKEYEIIKVVKSPKNRVGNTERRGIKQQGLWVFQLKKEEAESTLKTSPPARKVPAKPSTRKVVAKTKKINEKNTSTKKLVRARMNKIAKDLNLSEKK